MVQRGPLSTSATSFIAADAIRVQGVLYGLVFRVAIPGILPLVSALSVSRARLQARRARTGFCTLLAVGWAEAPSSPRIWELCSYPPGRRLLGAPEVWLLFSQGHDFVHT